MVDYKASAFNSLQVPNMDDESSIFLLTSVVQKKQGVTSVTVDSPSKTAKIYYEPSVTGARDILDVVRKSGFPDASLASKREKITTHHDEILQLVPSLYLYLPLFSALGYLSGCNERGHHLILYFEVDPYW